MLQTYTVSDANSTVLLRLDDPSFNTSLLVQFAKDVNRFICNAAEWPFMETTFNGVAAQGNVFFDLQSTVTNFQMPISLQLNAPDASAISMKYMQHREFFEQYPDPTALSQSRPSRWSMFGTTLVIGPAPLDDDYTFQLLYLKEPASITGTSSIFDVPNAFSELLILGMLSRAQMASDKYDLAQVTQQEFDIQLELMKKRLMKRQSERPVGARRPTWNTWT